MKLIDLLNKIANGEELPKKIKYEDIILEYDKCLQDYKIYQGGYLFTHLFERENCKFLNEEVEVCSTGLTVKEAEENFYKISEALYREANKKREKKMPKKLGECAYIDGGIAYSWSKSEATLKTRINEIIDYLDYLKSKGDE